MKFLINGSNQRATLYRSQTIYVNGGASMG